MRTRTIKRNVYKVNWHANGICYRTTTGCGWEDVKSMRQTARLIGDTITYEVIGVRRERYKRG